MISKKTPHIVNEIDESKIDSKIKEKVNLLKNEIVNSSLYKEYLYLKKSISEEKTLQKCFNLQKFLQKCDITLEEKRQYDEANKIINSSPLVSNFKMIENDLRNTLIEIKEILEKWL